MLNKLISLTNSNEYLSNCVLIVLEVNTINKELIIETNLKLKIIDESMFYDPINSEQVWQITCKNVKYLSNNLHESKAGLKQINIYNEHPLLLKYTNEVFINVYGNCTQISKLIGELMITHYSLTGDWLYFSTFFSALYRLKTFDINIVLFFPAIFLEKYSKIFHDYGLKTMIKEEQQGESRVFKTLIFEQNGSPNADVYFYQSSIVAEEFTAIRLI